MGKKTIAPILNAGDMANYKGQRGYFPITIVEVSIVDDSYINAAGNKVEKTKIDHYIVVPVRRKGQSWESKPFRAESWEVFSEEW